MSDSGVQKIHMLVVEDDEGQCLLVERMLREINRRSQLLYITMKSVGRVSAALKELRSNTYDLTLLDLTLPDSRDLSAITDVKAAFPDMPIVVFTANSDEFVGKSAVRLGVQDVLDKSQMNEYTLRRSIAYCLERVRTNQEIEELRFAQVRSLQLATIGEMAGGVAHEINNPLMVIRTYCERLRRVMKDDPVDMNLIKGAIDKVDLMAERMNRIVRSLQSLSRNDLDDDPEIVTLKSIVDDAAALCSERIRLEGIEFIIDVDQSIDVVCHPTQISQVLINLLNNAKDALAGSRASWIRVQGKEHGDSIIIEVEDSGVIEDTKVRDMLFSSYFTTKPRGKGTGLGLSISKSLIEKHHGTMELVDQENTCFRITLPTVDLFKGMEPLNSSISSESQSDAGIFSIRRPSGDDS